MILHRSITELDSPAEQILGGGESESLVDSDPDSSALLGSPEQLELSSESSLDLGEQ